MAAAIIGVAPLFDIPYFSDLAGTDCEREARAGLNTTANTNMRETPVSRGIKRTYLIVKPPWIPSETMSDASESLS
jgi:hypothetical protein